MSKWSVQDVKARFSQLLATCLAEGPQVITKRGTEAAVLVPIEQWKRLQEAARPSLKDFLLQESPRFELDLPDRKSTKGGVLAALRRSPLVGEDLDLDRPRSETRR
jgi:antitoxin Phd